MTASYRQKIAAFLLILPLLALGGIVAKNQLSIASSESWRVKIVGYDPRDLLYGHYLNFRFDWDVSGEQGACGAGRECCLCLEPRAEAMYPRASRQACDATGKCATSLPLPGRSSCKDATPACRKDADAFDPEGPQRYYIPENAATQLNALLVGQRHDLSVDLHVAASGQHYLGKLYVDGEEWSDYLRDHPDAGQTEPVRNTEHNWRMKITDARVYGDYLVFRLDWGAPVTRSACRDINGCCALCLLAQDGSTRPATEFRVCGAQNHCLESLIVPDTRRSSHTDLGFDPGGPQRYSLAPEDTASLARALALAPNDLSIDVTTHGNGVTPTFGELYVNGVAWRDYLQQHSEPKAPAELKSRPKK